MSSITVDGPGQEILLPVAMKLVLLTTVVQKMAGIDFRHAVTPVAQNSSLLPVFHPHMKWQAYPRSTLSISLSHPHLLIQPSSPC